MPELLELIREMRESLRKAMLWTDEEQDVGEWRAEAAKLLDAAEAALQVQKPGCITDTDRLNFLDECNRRLNAHYGSNYRWELILNHNVNRLMLGHLIVDLNDSKAHGWPSCREAIDREMMRIASYRRAATPPEQTP